MSHAPRLRLLESLSQQFEAQHLMQVLEGAGIEAYVDGLFSSSNIGVSTTMGVIKIRVRDEDYERAVDILRESRRAHHGEAWYCTVCQDTNEPNFDVCWNCQGERSQVEGQPPAPPPTEVPAFSPEELISEHAVDRSFDPGPYAPPQATPERPEKPAASAVPLGGMEGVDSEELEDTVQRAFRASVLGLVTVPFLLHCYSLVLLFGSLSFPTPWPSKATRQFRTALAIDVCVMIGTALLVRFVMQ